MSKTGWTYMILSVLTIGFILLMEYSKPKKINWFPSYVSHHKIPYGTYVLNDLLTHFFAERVKQVHKPPFELLSRDSDIQGTYFFVNEHISFDETELDALLDWVDQGNTLFVASNGFENRLLDTLNLEQYSIYNGHNLKPKFYHQLVNPDLDNKTVSFEKDYYTLTFSAIDTLNTSVLGEVYAEADSTGSIVKQVNVIKQPFGNGEIVLSTFPKAFTNYFILKDNNRDYTAGLLSYLKGDGDLFVDNFHKTGKSRYTSPMYLFLNTKEFKWAYYLVLIGALIYVIFEGKRKQRAIPVVTPLKNQTLAFTRTIADMYFEKGEQKQITQHKISYFLEYLRSRLQVSTQDLDEAFLKKLAIRSNNDFEDVKALFDLIKKLQAQQGITDSELQQLNKKIEAFKANVDGK